MKAYFWTFINFEQNDWVRFVLIVEFTYNNIKDASTTHMFFQLNCDYYLCVSYKEDIDLYFKIKLAKELSTKLQKLMLVCRKNFYHT